ncbi:hypothetical protein D3C71_2100730 [compost metagenome]
MIRLIRLFSRRSDLPNETARIDTKKAMKTGTITSGRLSSLRSPKRKTAATARTDRTTPATM